MKMNYAAGFDAGERAAYRDRAVGEYPSKYKPHRSIAAGFRDGYAARDPAWVALQRTPARVPSIDDLPVAA